MIIYWTAASGIALACMAAGYLLGVIVTNWHRDNEQIGAEIDAYEERIEERKAGRHARTQPRSRPERITWERDEAVGGTVTFTPSLAAPRAAADVILPAPDTYKPQPGRDSGDGTGTMPRIRLVTATTGEIRAIGDELVAAIEAGAPE